MRRPALARSTSSVRRHALVGAGGEEVVHRQLERLHRRLQGRRGVGLLGAVGEEREPPARDPEGGVGDDGDQAQEAEEQAEPEGDLLADGEVLEHAG